MGRWARSGRTSDLPPAHNTAGVVFQSSTHGAHETLAKDKGAQPTKTLQAYVPALESDGEKTSTPKTESVWLPA